MKRSIFLFIFSAVLCAQSARPGKESWRHYRNQRWGFCISYPQKWDHDEGVNKAGIAIFPPADHQGSEISVGALLIGIVNGHQPTIEEDFAAADNIRRQSGATDLVELDKHTTAVGAHSALFRKISYKEAAGPTWVEESIKFQTHDGLS